MEKTNIEWDCLKIKQLYRSLVINKHACLKLLIDKTIFQVKYKFKLFKSNNNSLEA